MVPPGEVTAARSASGPSSPSPSRAAAPTSVCRTSASDVSRVRPTSTPPSIIDSATRNTYAGPEPEPRDRVELRLLHAHHEADGTEHAPATSRCWSVAWVPLAIAAAPLPTSAPVLGIARTTGRPGSASSIAEMVMPAAIDSTSASPRTASAQLESASTTSVGFTATTTTSASVAAQAGLGTAHAREARLDGVASIGVDLRDHDRLRFPTRVDEADRQRLTHAATAE